MDEPPRIARLPRDKHGRPVPWFVVWLDAGGHDVPAGAEGAVPDFRVIKPGAIQVAVAAGVCWVCGVLFQRQEDRAFTIGPMCAVNRTTAEPPGHVECAQFSATHCPFLITPSMHRRDRRLPEGVSDPPGVFLRRNPGVALVWITRYNGWRLERGGLFDIGDPIGAEWYAHGREATHAEVMASLESGLPGLRELAADDPSPDGAMAALERGWSETLALIPG